MKRAVRRAVTHGDTIPVFVHHHDAQEHAKSEEEQPVDVVLDSVTDRNTEGEQHDLGDGEERSSEDDITDGPSVIECAEYE